MSTLALLTLVLVGILGIEGFAMLVKPAAFRCWLQRFPRDVWSGRILAALAILWAAFLLYDMSLGRFDAYKPLVWPLAIILTGFVWVYMDELLAPRALGALLLLYPAPVLAAARWHDSSWRVVMSFLAYVCVVKGMALLLSPYWFRMGVERFLATDKRCRLWGGVALAGGLFLLLLAVVVY
ncbi:MAG: hypothetical protein ACNA71_04475 [Kiritimatiellia bacterium]